MSNSDPTASHPQSGAKPSKNIVAVVEWLCEDKVISDIMANAGLGVAGVGVSERVEITYAPGEYVDEARVLRAVNYMIRKADETGADFKISCPKVISISS